MKILNTLKNNRQNLINNLIENIESLEKFAYEQQAEIEKLNVELVGMRGACESYKMHYDNAQAEIERLREGMNFERERVDNIPNLLLQAQSEAIKEFWSKLKEISSHVVDKDLRVINYVEISDGDNLVKEMVGDDNA